MVNKTNSIYVSVSVKNLSKHSCHYILWACIGVIGSRSALYGGVRVLPLSSEPNHTNKSITAKCNFLRACREIRAGQNFNREELSRHYQIEYVNQ